MNHERLKEKIRNNGELVAVDKMEVLELMETAEHVHYIENRLKHLLESDYIRQFDAVDPVTKEYVLDIREADNVAPVQHGRWSDKMIAYRAPGDFPEHGDFHFGFRCSVCGGFTNKTKFCGNCGARMDGGAP